jgi:hypothetical protein
VRERNKTAYKNVELKRGTSPPLMQVTHTFPTLSLYINTSQSYVFGCNFVRLSLQASQPPVLPFNTKTQLSLSLSLKTSKGFTEKEVGIYLNSFCFSWWICVYVCVCVFFFFLDILFHISV